MSATELKKMLKEARPKFGNTDEEIKKELEYHASAKKALANKEKMAKVREARLAKPQVGSAKGKATEQTEKKVPTVVQQERPAEEPEKKKKKAKAKAGNEEAPSDIPSASDLSARKAFLLKQLASLGSSL